MTLRGKRVVVTRPAHQAGELVTLLRARGAEVIEYPTIGIVPVGPPENATVAAAARELVDGEYDVLLLTSANAAKFVGEALAEAGASYASLAGADILCVGHATARVVEGGGGRPVVASTHEAEGMLQDACARYGTALPSKRFLLPRAREGRTTLVEGLEARGAAVTLVVVYDTVPLLEGPPLRADVPIDWLTFTSPSAIRAFAKRSPFPAEAKIAVVGPVTRREAEALGLVVTVMPSSASMAALVESLDQHRLEDR